MTSLRRKIEVTLELAQEMLNFQNQDHILSVTTPYFQGGKVLLTLYVISLSFLLWMKLIIWGFIQMVLDGTVCFALKRRLNKWYITPSFISERIQKRIWSKENYYELRKWVLNGWLLVHLHQTKTCWELLGSLDG